MTRRSILWCIMQMVCVLLTACGRVPESTVFPVAQTEPEAQNVSNNTSDGLYDYLQLYAISDEVAQGTEDLASLLALLQTGRLFPVEKYELEPGGAALSVDFKMSLSAGERLEVNYTQWMQDAAVLFALMPELQQVSYTLTQDDYSYVGAPIIRQKAEEAFGSELDGLAETAKDFNAAMWDRMGDVVYEPDVMREISYEHIIS